LFISNLFMVHSPLCFLQRLLQIPENRTTGEGRRKRTWDDQGSWPRRDYAAFIHIELMAVTLRHASRQVLVQL